MFKDLNLFINNVKILYEYQVSDEEIIIKTIKRLESRDTLKIYYDENIYDIELGDSTQFNLGKSGEIFVPISNNKLTFVVRLKNNYFVKSVYKYINKLIDKDMLIQEIKLFLNSKVGKKYNKDLTNLLSSIENKDKEIEDLIINNEDEYKRIFNLLINNKTYINMAKNMSDLELMLLITSNILVPNVPKINQDSFNDLVNAAKNYDNALENIWRLAMNYDCKGYNYDLLEEFLVNSKNVWYLGEYLNSVIQVNQENLIKKIIATNDSEYIKELLKDNFIISHLDDKYKNILKEYI